jgi:hypothetical protein
MTAQVSRLLTATFRKTALDTWDGANVGLILGVTGRQIAVCRIGVAFTNPPPPDTGTPTARVQFQDDSTIRWWCDKSMTMPEMAPIGDPFMLLAFGKGLVVSSPVLGAAVWDDLIIDVGYTFT